MRQLAGRAVIPWRELAEEIHANNVAKGFWDAERNEGELLMLMVSELAEAMEEHREGRPARWHELATHWGQSFPKEHAGRIEGILARLNDNAYTMGDEPVYRPSPEEFRILVKCGIAKPEGAAVELADCIIRALDALEPMSVNVTERLTMAFGWNLFPLPDNFGDALLVVTDVACQARYVGAWEKPNRLALVVRRCCELIERLGEDPEALIREKMAYNATRPHKHGKAY